MSEKKLPHVLIFMGVSGCGKSTVGQNIAEKLGLPPSECLVFEDSSAGVKGAKSADMHCVALVQQGRPPQDVSGADLVLNNLSEFSLEDYMESLRG